MLGGTSPPSGQRFDRRAIITVLDLVTEYISLYGCQLTIHGERERERERKKQQWAQYRFQRNNLGLENECLQAEGCAI